MVKLLNVFIFVFSIGAYAAEKAEPMTIIVQSMDDSVDLDQLAQPDRKLNVRYKKIDGFGDNQKYKSKDLPSTTQLNQDFQDAGLSSNLTQMDQLDRDLFYRIVKKENLKVLISRYPNFPAEGLKKLKNIIQSRHYE